MKKRKPQKPGAVKIPSNGERRQQLSGPKTVLDVTKQATDLDANPKGVKELLGPLLVGTDWPRVAKVVVQLVEIVDLVAKHF